MDKLERYRQLKEEAERYRRKMDMAEGSLRQLLEQLYSEYGCRNEAEAAHLLAKMESDLAELEDSFTREFSAFESDWKQHVRAVQEEIDSLSDDV